VTGGTIANSGIIASVTPNITTPNAMVMETYTIGAITDDNGCNAVAPFGSVTVSIIDLDPTFTIDNTTCNTANIPLALV